MPLCRFSDLEKLPIKDWSSLLVMIVIPAAFVLPEIEKCGRLGIKNIIIISAGLKKVMPRQEARSGT